MRHFSYAPLSLLCLLLVGCGNTPKQNSILGITVKEGTTLPTTVTLGNTATAYFTVSNNTLTERKKIYIKSLPDNVTQVTSDGTYEDTCAAAVDLKPKGQAGSSCTLQLTISGAVDSGQSLIACLQGGVTCVKTYAISVLELTSIAVTPASGEINVGETEQFTATGTYSDDSTVDLTSDVTWDSSSPATATVSPSGLATGVAVGSSDVTATFETLTGDSASLDVVTPLVSITITPASATIEAGARQQFTATGTYNDDSTEDITSSVTWASSSTATITVSSSGLATAVTVGSSTITASLDSITSNSATLEATPLRAYIVNLGSNSVSLCSIDPETGTLNDCQDSGASSLNVPVGVILSPDEAFLYVGNNGDNTVTACSVNADDGLLSDCVATGSGFNQPSGIAFNTTGTVAYVVNLGNSTISLCAVDSGDGTLSACAVTGNGFTAPLSIHLNASESLAYVTSSSSNTVEVCAVNASTGELSGCADSGSGAIFETATGITLNDVGDLAYVSNNGGGDILLCDVDATTGELSGCVDSGAGIYTGLHYNALNEANTRMYASRSFFGTTLVLLCDVDATTGEVSNCEDADGDTTAVFSTAMGLVLN